MGMGPLRKDMDIRDRIGKTCKPIKVSKPRTDTITHPSDKDSVKQSKYNQPKYKGPNYKQKDLGVTDGDESPMKEKMER